MGRPLGPLLAAVMLGGCKPRGEGIPAPSASAPLQPPPMASLAVSLGASAPTPPASSAPAAAGGPWVGCYGRFRPASTPLRDVTRLGLLCGPSNGMRPVGPAWEGQLDEGASADHAIKLDLGQCVRAFAVVGTEGADLDLTLLDPRGASLAADGIDDRWPILLPDRAVCAGEPGLYTLRVTARRGAGPYAAQAWLLP